MNILALITIISLSVIVLSPSFAQTGSRDILDEYCKNNWKTDPVQCPDYVPEGYFDRTPSEFSQNKFTAEDEEKRQQLAQNPDLKCPSGTYYGKDNQGNTVCRDSDTNQLVDPNTGLRFDSQTGNVSLNDNQTGGIVIGVIIIIIIIAGIAKAASSKSGSNNYETYQDVSRRGWTSDEKEQVRIRQGGQCAHCGKPPPRWEYHHKNGNRGDNGMRNCEGLCPNCHSVETHG